MMTHGSLVRRIASSLEDVESVRTDLQREGMHVVASADQIATTLRKAEIQLQVALSDALKPAPYAAPEDDLKL
jgi:hypothetical protein